MSSSCYHCQEEEEEEEEEEGEVDIVSSRSTKRERLR